jgi:hypothetical protein
MKFDSCFAKCNPTDGKKRIILVYGPQSTAGGSEHQQLGTFVTFYLADSQKKAGLVSSFSVVYHLGVGPLGVVEFPTRIVFSLIGMGPKIITLSLND